MNTELKRLYLVCRAAGAKAQRSIQQARIWIETIEDTSVIELTVD